MPGVQQAFDGGHFRTGALAGGGDASEGLMAVDQLGAGAAVAGVAADLGADEAEVVAQHLGEALGGMGVDFLADTVDDQTDRFERAVGQIELRLFDGVVHGVLSQERASRTARRTRVRAASRR